MGRAGPDPGVLVPEIAEGSLGFGVLWVEGREPDDRGGAFEGVANVRGVALGARNDKIPRRLGRQCARLEGGCAPWGRGPSVAGLW